MATKTRPEHLRRLSRYVLRRATDAGLAALALPSALVLGRIRSIGVQSLPLSKRVLLGTGVFPIRNHYYEPLFDYRALKQPHDSGRFLPGVDFNISSQLELLGKLDFADELLAAGLGQRGDETRFCIANANFGSGDAEYWYGVIRHFKPKRIIEVGSGHSTLMARLAIEANGRDDPSSQCEHVCIEPYEMPWLEKTGARIIRQRVEEVDLAVFQALGENDILFIDSSHVIRPHGDVLFEFLHLLPTLAKGVIVHVHDIFSPRDYPRLWLHDEIRLWNEQYLLEAFLTSNMHWKVIGALNLLRHEHLAALQGVCPYLEEASEPGSFYIQRVA